MLGRQADELTELSRTDALTGLFNSRGFAERLRSEIARSRRYRQPFALLFLDLDNLKGINDRYGHRAGSAALRHVAGAIRAELREVDLGARWGGDEFTILAPNTRRDAALALAERIRNRIADQEGLPHPWRLTASIGVATVDAGDSVLVTDSDTLIRNADSAMYEAKKRGKNTVVAADPPETAAELL
jgi:diguanylate cyclase (GGDEF)-like protein